MNSKQQAHALLDTVIHACAHSSKDYKAKIDLPFYDLVREQGFSGEGVAGNVRLTITVKFMDKDEMIYESETSFTTKNTQRN